MRQDAIIRTFDSGATRDLDASKLDFEGFLSPLVLKRFAEYMHANRGLADGAFRDSDNWQRGIPPAVYMKSGFRHFFDWWSEHRGIETPEGLERAICALLFNAMGYLHEHLKSQPVQAVEWVDPRLEDDEDLGLKAGEALG